VEDNVAHIGIVGENVLYEKNKAIDIVEQLVLANAAFDRSKKNGSL
jgi:ATP phosphoribosyltransferase